MNRMTATNDAASACDKLLEYAGEYEHEMIRRHILTNPDTTAYHWSMVPEEYLYESGYINDFNKHRLERLMRKKDKREGVNRVRDYGFDGLARTRMGSEVVYSGLQAKYHTKKVSANDLGTFLMKIMELRMKNPSSKGYLYTTSRLQADLADSVANPSYPIRHVLHPWKPVTESAPRIVTRECDKKLRPDQEEKVEQLDADGVNALDAPCRWGKTIVSGHNMKRKHWTLAVVIAPLLVSVEHLQERLECFFPDYPVLVVDTDGTTNIEDVANFLEKDGKRIIYSTFDSAVDILATLPLPRDSYILADEIHNASAALCKFINKFHQGLVMSATLPEEIKDRIQINRTAKIPFSRAIKDGIIVDYTLWLPHLTKPGEVDIEIPVEFLEYDSELAAKAFYLAAVMLKSGSRRCITYLSRQEECDRFVQVVARIFEDYHGLTIWTGKIDSTISKHDRKKALDAFQSGPNEVYHILTSVRILDEAVDIPRCDSVFIANIGEQSSDIRVMQRSQRSSTKDPANPSKHNNIILWADGWEKCVGSLELLREADPEFHKKVRIADCRYDIQTQPKRVEQIVAEIRDFRQWSEMKCLTILEKHALVIQKLKAFVEEHEETPVHRGQRLNEQTLATWIHNRRQERRKGTISSELENMIRELPWWSWDPLMDGHKKTIKELTEFVDEHGDPPGHGGERLNEQTLATWINKRRQEKRKGTLSSELENMIRELPWWSWDPHMDSHNKAIEELKAFVEEHQEPPIRGGKRPNENTLASWIKNRRTDKQKGTLSAELENMILELPWWSWDPFMDGHKKTISELKEFYEKYGPPVNKGKRLNEQTLASWISSRRVDKRKGKLSAELENMILELPWWSWDPFMDGHKKTISELKEFYEEHAKPPAHRGKRPNEKTLATWIAKCRMDKRNGTISSELEKMIEKELPWVSW